MTHSAESTTELNSKEHGYRHLTPRQQALVVTGAAIGLAFGFGPAFLGVTGILLKPMAASFEWGRADIAILPTLAFAGLAVGAPMIGYVADRAGWNKVIALSIVLLSLGMMAVAVAPPNHFYIMVVGLTIGLVGTATSPAGYIAVVSLVFDRRLGLAMGAAMIGVGIGAVSIPIIVGMLLERMDWRQIFAGFGVASLLLGLIAHRLIFRVVRNDQSPAGNGTSAPTTKGIPPVGTGLLFSQAVKDYRFWLIGGVSALVAATIEGAFVHLAAYATDRGASVALASQSAGLMGLAVGVARPAFGFLLDKVFAPLVALGSFLLGAAGLYLLTVDIVQFPWLVPASAFLVGLAMGAQGDLMPFLAKRYFGVRAFGSIYGALVGIFAMGAASGTYAYGWSHDLFKSYTPGYQGAALVCCVCGLALLTLGRYRFVYEIVPGTTAIEQGADDSRRTEGK